MVSSSFRSRHVYIENNHHHQQQPLHRSAHVISDDDDDDDENDDENDCRSGYSTDEEEDSLDPWKPEICINLKRKHEPSSTKQRTKIRKVDQNNNFAAFNAVADLTRAGLLYPKTNATISSRTNSSLDLSNVRLNFCKFITIVTVPSFDGGPGILERSVQRSHS